MSSVESALVSTHSLIYLFIYLFTYLLFRIIQRDGNAAVTFKLKFSRSHHLWQPILSFQLAMENGTFLGSPGVIDEASCETKDDSHCKFANHLLLDLEQDNDIQLTIKKENDDSNLLPSVLTSGTLYH